MTAIAKKAAANRKANSTLSPTRVSILEAEVLRLEKEGSELVQTSGKEHEGVLVLEKAIWARARFHPMNIDVWQRAEQFVVLCNQLAVRVSNRVDEGYIARANAILATAERVLLPEMGQSDPFAGFHPLRQHLLACTISNAGALCREADGSAELELSFLERAVAAEGSRPSTLVLFNYSSSLARSSRFDDAASVVKKAVELASHNLTLHLNIESDTERPWQAFVGENASNAVLCHHLISTLSEWCGLQDNSFQHAVLGLRCAERYLGEQHALTSRSVLRVRRLESAAKMEPADDVAPTIPLQMQSFSMDCLPSALLPFSLVSPFSVEIACLPPNARQLNRMLQQMAIVPKLHSPTQQSIHPPQQQQSGVRLPLLSGPGRKQQQASAPPSPSLPSTPRVHNPRQQQQFNQPRPPPTTAPARTARADKKISVVPKKDFELYQKLQAEVNNFLLQNEVTVAKEVNSRRAHPGTLLQVDPLDERVVSNKMVESESRLHELSEVRPDHTDEDEIHWDIAARCLQRNARAFISRCRVRTRRQAVALRIQQMEAVEKIEQGWQFYQLRQDAKRRVKERKWELYEVACATQIQSFSRSWLSYSQYLCAVKRDLEFQIANLANWKLQQSAAICIQSVWRSHATRVVLHRRWQAARRVQRFVRIGWLFNKVKLAVFRKRSILRERLRIRNAASTRIQRWFRHEFKRVKAYRLRLEKQRAVADYVNGFVDKEMAAWNRIRNVDERKMGMIILRFFRFAKRKRDHERAEALRLRRERAASKIQRLFRWWVASAVKDRRFDIRVQGRLERRLAEERTEAAIDIQKIVRGRLARAAHKRRLDEIQHIHDAATCIQRGQKVWQCAKNLRAQISKKSSQRDRYLEAATRCHAATTVQAMYRAWRDRRYAREYGAFMRVDRHVFARRIQRGVRQMIARKQRRGLAAVVIESRESAAGRELRECSARRIQQAYRSSKIRGTVKSKAAIPVSRRNEAAARIQQKWRRYMAKTRVQQLLMQRHNILRDRVHNEHLHAYALMIQRVARRTILSDRAIQDAQDKRAVKASFVITRAMRRNAAKKTRKREIGEAMAEEDVAFEQEEKLFSVLVLQKFFRGLPVKNRFLRARAAVCVISRAFRSYKARQKRYDLSTQRERKMFQQKESDRDEAAKEIQRTWRDILSTRRLRQRRNESTQSLLEMEQQAAATVIQRLWRLHCERKRDEPQTNM